MSITLLPDAAGGHVRHAANDAAMIWIIRNQFGRRNLAPFTRAELALKLEPMLAKMPKNSGTAGKGRPRKGGTKSEPPNDTPTLADSGIDKKTSSRAQQLAAVSAKRFDEAMAKGMAGDLNPNRVAKDLREEAQRENRKAKRVEAARDAPALDSRIIVGDFREHADIIVSVRQPPPLPRPSGCPAPAPRCSPVPRPPAGPPVYHPAAGTRHGEPWRYGRLDSRRR